MGQHRTDRAASSSCAAKRRSCSATRNFAEVSLVPKMARTPDEVLAFLRDLAASGKPYAERDMAELTAFARAELGARRARGVGPSLRVREACASRATAFPTRR